MQSDELSARLASISTQWTKLFEAHQDVGQAAPPALRELLLRYYPAVYRYLLGTLRDQAAADELTQEFAVRFLRGDFKQADPERGRFRDFLKTSLRRLAIDHWRKQGQAAAPLEAAECVAIEASSSADLDRDFLDKWREELLQKAWEGLAGVEETTGQPCYSLLRHKTEHPEVRSAQLADYLRAQRGKVLTVEAVRQLLHRAREKFMDLLLEEVARSLPTTDPARLEQELLELDLLEYCRPALKRWPGRTA
jgi:RNA polymerase sigma-70 factor (ECF subfamily)